VRAAVALPATWTPLCMEPDEWADWQRLNPIRSNGFNAMRDHEAAASPCTDCPLGYAAEMRAVSRCNGQPGAVEEDEEGVIHTLSTGSPASDSAFGNRYQGLGGLVDNPIACTESAPDNQWCLANRIPGAHR
jgi:hypothetical protein